MSARAAVLNNPEVAKLLKTRFVCYAADNVVNPQWTAAEREWLKDRGGRASTGGMTVFTAGGRILPYGSSEPGFPGFKKALEGALSKYQPEDAPQVEKPDPKELAQVVRRPFEGGLALIVTYTVREWKDPPDLGHPSSLKAEYEKVIAECPGVDRLWARKVEADALAAGELPAKLEQRLALHVAYGMGDRSKVKKIDLKFRARCLTGSFQLENGQRADVLGFVETKGGKISRFEVIVKGTGIGGNPCGGLGPLHILAKGKTAPVAIGFMLADPESALGRVPPHSARDLDRPAIKGNH